MREKNIKDPNTCLHRITGQLRYSITEGKQVAGGPLICYECQERVEIVITREVIEHWESWERNNLWYKRLYRAVLNNFGMVP